MTLMTLTCCETGCKNVISDRLAASGTMGSMVMCEQCWIAYHNRFAKGSLSSFEETLPFAQKMASELATGYGEDSGDNVRSHTAELFGR